MAKNTNTTENAFPTKVSTGTGRLTYAYVWEPREQEGQEAKYSTSFLIPKSDEETINKLKAAINAAAQQGAEKLWGGKYPKGLKVPLRDGDEEADEKGEEYAGHYFINASSKKAPGIVDRKKNPILEQEEVYSGCYARISVNMFAFNSNGNKGIGCGLLNIQKVADGEPLAGIQSSPEEDFDDLGDDISNQDLSFGEEDEAPPVQQNKPAANGKTGGTFRDEVKAAASVLPPDLFGDEASKVA